MKLVCPHCGAAAGMDAWQNDAHVRQFIRVVAEMPMEISLRAVGYIALFRPTGGRGLSWQKALRLVSELDEMGKRDRLTWKRQPPRPVSPRTWGQALEKILAQPPKGLPLESHGYLQAIAYGLADEADRTVESERVASDRKAAQADRILSPQEVQEKIAALKSRIGKEI